MKKEKTTKKITQGITEHEQAEEALQESEDRYRTILEEINEGYYEIDLAGNFTFVNDAECRDLGYPREELIGMNYKQYTDEENAKKIYDIYTNVYKTGKVIKYEGEFIKKNGTKGFNKVSVSLIKNKEGQLIGFRGLSRDISERKRAEEALRESEKRYRELSIVDDLTQLYNSRYFYIQVEVETKRTNRYGQPLTLLLLDLDNFKRFNDIYGHVEGDQVLSRFGQVIKGLLRETDSAYRYGGEEFTILLPMTKKKDGSAIAERIRVEFKKEIFSPIPGQDVHMTVSIGVGQYEPKEAVKDFVHRVDQLMYQGKNNGKDQICMG